MTMESVAVAGGRETTGTFRYLRPSVRSSLFRNGGVLTRRDRDGSDSGMEGVHLEERSMPVHDGRSLQGTVPCTLDAKGFELLSRPLGRSDLDFFRHAEVVHEYYVECARIVLDATGASAVFPFDHNVRSAAGKNSERRMEGGQQVQGPAHLVHGDYTLASAPERLQALARPPSGNDTLGSVLEPGQSLIDPELVRQATAEPGRFSIINVWRNIAAEPVATHPLALCDARTVSPGDLVVFEIHYPDRVGENYFAKHAQGHRWVYFPRLSRDEALLIKQWDSAGTLARSRGTRADSSDRHAPCTFSFHSAFEDPSTPDDAPERWSIEVRCMALFT